uniref:Uncharacterized protein n=1 Tax=Oryza punctata TaxID=4537 RepID=A0A0E0KNB2_ORYPU
MRRLLAVPERRAAPPSLPRPPLSSATARRCSRTPSPENTIVLPCHGRRIYTNIALESSRSFVANQDLILEDRMIPYVDANPRKPSILHSLDNQESSGSNFSREVNVIEGAAEDIHEEGEIHSR